MGPEVKIIETEYTEGEISYLDFGYTEHMSLGEYDHSARTTHGAKIERAYDEGKLPTMSLDVKKKYYKLDKLISDKVDDEILKRMKTLADIHMSKEGIREKFTLSRTESHGETDYANQIESINSRKLISKIISAGSYIAVQSRRGPGNYIIVSEKIFEEFKLLEHCRYLESGDVMLTSLKVIINNSVGENVLVYRKTKEDEPGLIVVTNGTNYSIEEIGDHPETNFARVVITD